MMEIGEMILAFILGVIGGIAVTLLYGYQYSKNKEDDK